MSPPLSRSAPNFVRNDSSYSSLDEGGSALCLKNREDEPPLVRPNKQVRLVSDGLTAEEQARAQPGVHLVPYSQFPPASTTRGDCVYHSTPALVVPDSYENMHACENRMPRRVMSAWRAAGIVHALEKWAGRECGDAVTGVDKAWRAALAHGFRPYDQDAAGKRALSDDN